MSRFGYVRGLVLSAILAVALVAASAGAAAPADDIVIATVNGNKILKKDVMSALKEIPMQPGTDAKDVFPFLVDQMINEKLLDTASAAAKVEQTEDYKKGLNMLKAQLARQVYVSHALKEKVSQKAIQAEYDKFRDENKNREEIHARHLLVKTKEEADQAIRDLNDGMKFEDLVKQRSFDKGSAANGGDLGWFVKEDMLPEFSDAAFKLKPGEYSKEPVQTKFGWHVVKVEDRRMRQVPEIKQVEQAIREKLSRDAVEDLLKSLRSKADIKMFDMDGKPLTHGNSKPADSKAAAPEKAADPATAKKQ